MPSTLAIRKVDTNSVFAIGYLYWTISRHGLILETSFTGYRHIRYRRNPTESANGRNKRHRTQGSGPRHAPSR